MEMGLEFEDVEFSTAYGDYIASFAGEDGTELLQLLSPLWWASWQTRPSASAGICAVWGRCWALRSWEHSSCGRFGIRRTEKNSFGVRTLNRNLWRNIELFQLILGRSFDIDDWICNFLGIIIGFFIAVGIKAIRRTASK